MHPIPRSPSGRKGDNGKVLIIGGSKDYIGAPALAGVAALRSGCDLVTIASPEKVAWAINKLSPDLITRKLKGAYLSLSHLNELKKLVKTHDTILIGNGTGLKPTTKKLIRKAIQFSVTNAKYLVIDADALKVITIQGIKNAILTPHKKELEILLKNSNLKQPMITGILSGRSSIRSTSLAIRGILRNRTARDKKKGLNIVILLKGPVDAIISEKRAAFNTTGNAGMTKAGTGDILAGLCAGFLAQSRDPFRSAKLAAYYNGLAGDRLKNRRGFTYLASDLAAELTRIKNARKSHTFFSS